MSNIEIFRHRYKALISDRPSIVSSGFWFFFVYFLSRLMFILAFAGVIVSVLWILNIISLPGEWSGLKKTEALQTIVVFFFLFVMFISGFSARMAKRVVIRNGYIASLEILIEETILTDAKDS